MKYLVNLNLSGAMEIESNSIEEARVLIEQGDPCMEFNSRYSGRVSSRIFTNKLEITNIEVMGGQLQKFTVKKEQYFFYYLKRDGSIGFEMSNIVNTLGQKKYFTVDLCKYYRKVKDIEDLMEFTIQAERLGAKTEEINRLREKHKITKEDIEKYIVQKQEVYDGPQEKDSDV